MDPSLWWAVRAESPGGLPLAHAETLTLGGFAWVSDWRCLWLSSLPLACPTSPLSRSAPRILWLPVLQSVIPVHIQVSVTVRILFAAAHDEARACGRQGVRRARGQQDEAKDPLSVP